MTPESCVRSSVALFPLLLGGCFSYVALGAATPRRGTDVVAKLSTPLAVPLQDVTVREVNATTGKVTYADDDSLVLAVEHFRSDAGTDYPGLGTTITIRRDHIAELQERRIAAGKTVLLLGAGAVALGAIVYSVGPLLGSTSGAPPGPPTPP
jgi:hypothetical protein